MKSEMQRAQQNQPRRANEQGTSDTIRQVGVVVGLVLALPACLAWWHVSTQAAKSTTWARSTARKRAAIGVSVLGPVAAFVAMEAWPQLITGRGIVWCLILALLVWWAATAPAVPFAWSLSRARIATQIDKGRHDGHTTQAVTEAIWEGSGWNADRDAAVAPTMTARCSGVFGVLVSDDRRDPGRRRETNRGKNTAGSGWVEGSAVILPDGPASAILLGGTGSGKTVLALDMVAATLRERNSAVFFNVKGDSATTRQLVQIAADQGIPCYQWRLNGGCPFDAWLGDSEAIIGKVVGLLGKPTTDAALYYQHRTYAVLRDAAAERASNGLPPWARSSELIADLVAYRTRSLTPTEVARVRADVVAGISGLTGVIDGRGHPQGWSWETTERRCLVIVTIDPNKPAAIRAAVLMLADLAAYKEERLPSDEPRRLVVLDEAQILLTSPVAPPVPELMEQLRSSGIGLVITAQSVGGLGDPATAERLLDCGVPIIAGRMPNPTKISERGGTVYRSEAGEQGDGGQLTGLFTTRTQQTYRLPPDRVRSFPQGHFALVTRHHTHIFVALPPQSWAA